MAVITRETAVSASADAIWDRLIDDPNKWMEWLTPIRGFEERVNGAVKEGMSFSVQVGNMGGAKLKVVQVQRGKLLRWKVGPSMMMAMGMSMRGTLELVGTGGTTRVKIRMVTPMMMAPMMKMMTGIKPKDEMTKTIGKIKSLGEAN